MPLTSYETMTKFRDNLRKLMGIYGLNQVELAKKSGVEQSLISKHLSGHPDVQTPSLNTLVALANALHCTLEELTGLDSLKNIEKKAEAVGDLSAEEKAILEAYSNLTDDDWEKRAVEKILLKAKEVDKKKESDKNNE